MLCNVLFGIAIVIVLVQVGAAIIIISRPKK